MMAYGNQNSFDEMRIRVVLELAANKDQYLDQTILQLGHPHRHNLALQYAMYSRIFSEKVDLREALVIEDIFCKEVETINTNGQTCGMWQIHVILRSFATKSSVSNQHLGVTQ